MISENRRSAIPTAWDGIILTGMRQKRGYCRNVLLRLRFDNETIRKVTKLIFYHDYRPEPEPAEVRKAVYNIGADLFPDYLAVQWADNCAKSTFKQEMKFERIRKVNEVYLEILGKGECLSLKQLKINGNDLVKEGIRGKEVGDILESALAMVLKDQSMNDRELLLQYAAISTKRRHLPFGRILFRLRIKRKLRLCLKPKGICRSPGENLMALILDRATCTGL